jgi:hypothetical protein
MADNNIIDKTTDMYIVTLKFVNALLTNMNMNVIDDLLNFKQIKRVDFTQERNIATLYELADEIFKLFDKQKCGFYIKNEYIVLNVLKNMCKQQGLKLASQVKVKHTNNLRSTITSYTIKTKVKKQVK